MKNRVKNLLSDTIVFAIGNMLSKLILFFLMPFYTTVLTVSEYGISDTINNFVELLLPISTLCVSEAVFRFLIDKNSREHEVIKNGIVITTIGCLIITLFLLIISNFFVFYWIWYLIILLWTQAIRQLLGYSIRGLGKSKEFAITGLFATIVLVVSNVFLLKYLHLKIEGYLMSIIFSNFFTIILSLFYLRHTLGINKVTDNKRRETDLTKNMLKYSFPIIPNNISWWVNTASSRYILLFFLGSTSTGMYAAASKLPAVVNMLASIFQQAWLYSASKIFTEEKENNNKFYSLIFNNYTMFLNLGCSFIIVIIPFIAKILLKADFYDAWKFVSILLISACLGAYSVFFGGIYAATMNNKVVMQSTMLGSIVNIILSILLVPIIGIYGVTIASLLCYLVIVMHRYFDLRKLFDFEFNNWKIIASFSIMLLQSIIHIYVNKLNIIINFCLFFVMIILYIKDLNKLFKIALKNIKE